MLNATEYQVFFKGYSLVDAAIRSRDSFSFLLKQDEPEGGMPDEAKTGQRVRLINFFTQAEPNDRIDCGQYLGFLRAKLAVSTQPKLQAVLVDSSGEVAVLGGGDDDMEQTIVEDPDGPRRSIITAVATLFGHVYAVGLWRSVAKRLGPNQWESLCTQAILPKPGTGKGVEFGTHWGFQAIDGFAPDDLYATGGHGEVWHYDGQVWKQCPLPTNLVLYNVCCAGDGQVYIGAQSGSILRGREDHWEVIHQGSMTLPFKDMVWYQDRVWCTSDYGLWQIVDGQLIEADVPLAVRACAGNLAVGDGVMLLAGIYGATVYDGQQWQALIDFFALAKTAP
ncbi:WD40/YVTN/BNR-like repeat-containing protein [Chitinimonas lacunae]|uniref:WD40/YVTN/BNR-like repeat-containing protein n=1 Tax=Chitinimonas lacunae TaxID=1963018 RepID=A0ABV8MY68_9NEIS